MKLLNNRLLKNSKCHSRKDGNPLVIKKIPAFLGMTAYQVIHFSEVLNKTFYVALLITGFCSMYAADFNNKIGIDEKLGAVIPGNVSFYDSHGKKVLLGDLIGKKPTIIDFAYYKCTGICTPLMMEIASVINKVDLQPGKDYNIVTISFNPDETVNDAASKKTQMINLLNTKINEESWKFLVGDSISIKKVTEAAGFNYQREEDTFLHTGVLIFVSPDGKICRYLKPDYNTRGDYKILPFDFKMAILEASKGQEIPVVDQALRYCFSYQPKNQTYVFNLFKVSGTVIVMSVVLIFFLVIRKPKKSSVVKHGIKQSIRN